MGDIIQNIELNASDEVFSYITYIIRFVLPVLAAIVLFRCLRSMLQEKNENEVWGYLTMPNGGRVVLNHWENIIGRAKSVDVQLNFPTVSRSHAAIIRDDKGEWTIYDLKSRGGITVNGEAVEGEMPLEPNDVLSLGGVEMVFIPITRDGESYQASVRGRQGRIVSPTVTFIVLTEFILLLSIQLCISYGDSFPLAVPECFIGLAITMWIYYAVMRFLRRSGFEVETIAFLLCSVGLAVAASAAPEQLTKQFISMLAGVAVFIVLGIFLRDLNRAKALRWPMAAAALLLLAVNVIMGQVVYGAQNWIYIGGISVQPSELVKIAFVFAGAATLDRLFAKRNLIMFIGFSGVCVLALAYMGDFGTAMIFFVAFLVIAFLRSGDIATVALSVAGAVFAGGLAIRFKPYIAARFSTWLHAWDDINGGGYQQTRAMSAAASGGLFGEGAGNGWFKKIIAADTDLVFGMVSEELGLIIAVIMVFAVLALVFFAVRSAGSSRSSFYTIAACAAASMLAFQMILNVFGSVDLLPFTGVTFPFVSRGGSSMVSCWGMLAFIKAVDTRQNASFAIKLPKRLKHSSGSGYEDDDEEYYEDGCGGDCDTDIYGPWDDCGMEDGR